MKKKFSTELAYVLGIVLVAWGVVLMEKADFGVSMVVAPAYLLYRWLSPAWHFFTFGILPAGRAAARHEPIAAALSHIISVFFCYCGRLRHCAGRAYVSWDDAPIRRHCTAGYLLCGGDAFLRRRCFCYVPHLYIAGGL